MVNAGQTSGQYSAAAISAGGALTIKGNITDNSLPIKIAAVYHDDETGQDTTLEAQGFVVKTANAGALFQVVLTQSKGNSFDASNNVNTLTAEAKCFRGGVQDIDGITFRWYSLNIKTQTWELLSQGIQTVSGISILTVKPSDVLNVQTFKCEAQDGTEKSEAIVTFEDRTDPYSSRPQVCKLRTDKAQPRFAPECIVAQKRLKTKPPLQRSSPTRGPSSTRTAQNRTLLAQLRHRKQAIRSSCLPPILTQKPRSIAR